MQLDLNRYLNGQPTVARPIRKIEKAIRWSQRNKRLSITMALAGMLTLALLCGSLLFALTVAAKNREITKRQSETMESRIQAVIDAQPEALASAIGTLGDLSPSAETRLSNVLYSKTIRRNSRVNAAITLGLHGTPHSEFIIASLDDLIETPHVCQNLSDALRADPQAIVFLKASMESAPSANEKAKRIILLATLGDYSAWQEAADNLLDPTVRTAVTQIYGRWHANPTEIADKLADVQDENWAWTLCAALLSVDSRTLSDETITYVVDRLKSASTTSHYTTFRFAQLAIQKLAPMSMKQLSWDHPDVRNFSNGIHMIRIRPGKTELGKFDKAKINTDHPPRTVTLTRGYFLADSEVTVKQYAEFAAEQEGLARGEDWIKLEKFNREVSPSNSHPINQVSWFDAVKFCNWLSEKNGLTPAYRKIESPIEIEDDNGNRQVLERWRVDMEANGFRLPTDAEWEFASRNNSKTLFHFGSDRSHLKDFGHGSSARFIPCLPVYDLYPNSRGLHGMLGNVWEWTNNRYEQNEKSTPLIDPMGPEDYVNENYDRVFQGGGIDSASGGLDSEVRGNTSPFGQFYNLGFRVCLSDLEPGD